MSCLITPWVIEVPRILSKENLVKPNIDKQIGQISMEGPSSIYVKREVEITK